MSVFLISLRMFTILSYILNLTRGTLTSFTWDLPLYLYKDVTIVDSNFLLPISLVVDLSVFEHFSVICKVFAKSVTYPPLL